MLALASRNGPSVRIGLAALGLLAASAPLAAEDAPADMGVEAALVKCIVDKDFNLAVAIKTAPSQEAFMAALKKGVELCPVNVDQLSFGLFFKALNKAVTEKKAASGASE